MIEVSHVSRRYGSVYALTDVNLTIADGVVLGLLGQNGAGKTTLLNILTGYLAPSDGFVKIGGDDPLLEPEAAKSRIGYLPEHPPLYDEMTVLEYLSFVAELRCVPKKQRREHVENVMERTGLFDMRSRLIGHLSKGYRQRCGIAQAICSDPEVLILDEPTVGLDPKQITEMRALIRELSHGRTIVFSSHILTEVQQLCDQVVILEKGKVMLDRPVASVTDGDEIKLRVRLACPKEKAMNRLRSLEGIRRVNVLACDGNDESEFELVFTNEQAPERRLFSVIRSMDVPILRLNRVENNLESVFLNAISE